MICHFSQIVANVSAELSHEWSLGHVVLWLIMMWLWFMGLVMAAESFDWVVLNDTVMGGRSSAQIEQQRKSTRFTGIVSTENNGGFASMRTRNTLDLSNNTTVQLEVTGTDATVQFVVWMGQGANLYYATPIAVNSGIQSIDFADFTSKSYGRVVAAPSLDKRNRQKVSVGLLVGNGFEGPFELTLSKLDFVGEAQAVAWTIDTNVASSVSQVLQRAIQRGVPVYNMGDPSECAAIYQTALEDILLLSGEDLPEEVQVSIQETLENARALGASDRAWAYRRQMDELLTSFQ